MSNDLKIVAKYIYHSNYTYNFFVRIKVLYKYMFIYCLKLANFIISNEIIMILLGIEYFNINT